jgi:hypothetical protein
MGGNYMIIQITDINRFIKTYHYNYPAVQGMIFEVYGIAKIKGNIEFLVYLNRTLREISVFGKNLRAVGLEIIDPRISVTWNTKIYNPPLLIEDLEEQVSMKISEFRGQAGIVEHPEILMQMHFNYDDAEKCFLENAFRRVQDDFGSFILPLDWYLETDESGKSVISRNYTSGSEIQLIEFEFDIKDTKKMINHPLTGEMLVEGFSGEVIFNNGCSYKVLHLSNDFGKFERGCVVLRQESLGKMFLQVGPIIDPQIMMNMSRSFSPELK